MANVAVAPMVEEMTYRGLRFAVVRSALGQLAAVMVTRLAFGLSHGLVVGLPVLALFGVLLGVIRWRTESLYPPVMLDAAFNAATLARLVIFGGGI